MRDALRARGIDAVSCDILPSDAPGPHLQGYLEDHIGSGREWSAIIAFPPCTYLSSSGLFRNKNNPERTAKTEAALAFVAMILSRHCPLIAVENPVGRISTAIRPYTQAVQPYEFGEDASKKTCLWLKGLPPLVKDPAKRIPGRIVTTANGRRVERWANQTDSGQNRLGPSENRAAIRGITYRGIADAMAEQWAPVILAQERRC